MTKEFRIGDRIESIAGDDKGLRGFVTDVVPGDQTPIHWIGDDHSKIRCIPERIRHVDPNPPGWVPRCGDRVRVLIADLKGRSGYVVNTEKPGRIFISVPALGHACAGPYAPSELELSAPARPGAQEFVVSNNEG